MGSRPVRNGSHRIRYEAALFGCDRPLTCHGFETIGKPVPTLRHQEERGFDLLSCGELHYAEAIGGVLAIFVGCWHLGPLITLPVSTTFGAKRADQKYWRPALARNFGTIGAEFGEALSIFDFESHVPDRTRNKIALFEFPSSVIAAPQRWRLLCGADLCDRLGTVFQAGEEFL